jgi:hypothetical protein
VAFSVSPCLRGEIALSYQGSTHYYGLLQQFSRLSSNSLHFKAGIEQQFTRP